MAQLLRSFARGSPEVTPWLIQSRSRGKISVKTFLSRLATVSREWFQGYRYRETEKCDGREADFVVEGGQLGVPRLPPPSRPPPSATQPPPWGLVIGAGRHGGGHAV